jgi:hypothetical protein
VVCALYLLRTYGRKSLDTSVLDAPVPSLTLQTGQDRKGRKKVKVCALPTPARIRPSSQSSNSNPPIRQSAWSPPIRPSLLLLLAGRPCLSWAFPCLRSFLAFPVLPSLFAQTFAGAFPDAAQGWHTKTLYLLYLPNCIHLTCDHLRSTVTHTHHTTPHTEPLHIGTTHYTLQPDTHTHHRPPLNSFGPFVPIFQSSNLLLPPPILPNPPRSKSSARQRETETHSYNLLPESRSAPPLWR